MDLDIFFVNILRVITNRRCFYLSRSSDQHLEGKDLLVLAIVSHTFTIENAGLHVFRDAFVKSLDQVGVFGGIVFAVSAEDLDGSIGEFMNLLVRFIRVNERLKPT